MFINLFCGDCDNEYCTCARNYIPEGSKEGCTREVDEQQQELLYHYKDEVLPFLTIGKITSEKFEKLQEIDKFMHSIYNCPLGRKIDQRGKVVMG